jgi:hypothetical protein
VLVHEGAGSRMVWETVVGNYFIFFLSSRSLGFLFAVINFIDGFMRLSHSEIKQEVNVIASLIAELCSFEMVHDITLVCQQTIRIFTAVFVSGFRLKFVKPWRQISSVCWTMK